MAISLGWSIFVWLLVLLAVYGIARYFYVKPWDSLVLAILMGYLFLLVFVPFGSAYSRSDPWVALYIVIAVTSPLVLAVYIILCASSNRAVDNGVLSLKDKTSNAIPLNSDNALKTAFM